jgi:hypothetical protein
MLDLQMGSVARALLRCKQRGKAANGDNIVMRSMQRPH